MRTLPILHLRLAFTLCFSLALFFCTAQAQAPFSWKELPPLPPAAGESRQAGLASPFAGIHNDALIIAGGANFPDKLPWEGGTKKYWDDIFVLERSETGDYEWHIIEDTKLPMPLAYGVAISLPEGLLCIGGMNSQHISEKVILLQWDSSTKQLVVTEWPSLPKPLANMTGSQVNDKIYVAGGQQSLAGEATKTFWEFDLNRQSWKSLSPWPGPARILPVAATQSNGTTNCFYLFSGRNTQTGKETAILQDAYRYNPLKDEWQMLPPVSDDEQSAVSVMAGSAVASGSQHILVIGGDDSKLFTQLEELDREINVASDSVVASELLQQKLGILHNHPGFSRNILSFNTITKNWSKLAELPFKSPVTTQALWWGNDLILPSGEVQPGIRTDKIWRGLPGEITSFGWVNYSVLGVYLLLLVGLGIYFSRRENTTDDYFKAGGRIPWWATGLSIFGTQLSAITFMAIPAKAYATDWGYFMLNMTIILVAPIIIGVFLPFFRRLNITTAYQYLELRFNGLTRLIGSTMLVVLQFGRIGIVLFLPSIALSLVTGMDVYLCILVMGVLSIFYTVLGGIEAVVWTDVLQVVVLLGGAMLCLVLIPWELDGGWSKIIDIAVTDQKFHLFDMRFDWTEATFWVVLIGGIGANIISYGSDQVVVQRYLTTKDEKSAAQSIWVGAILALPASLIFFGLGTALYAFYYQQPELLATTLANQDAILPHFIVTQLPAGVAGLLIAGIFAAAMSSLDSSMNSVATVVTTDFYQRFFPDSPESQRLRVAKWTTALVGISGTIFALFMASWDIKSLWDQLNTFIGLFAGGLGGVFLLGICTRRANGIGAVSGLLISGITQFIIKEYTTIHFLLYTATGIISCFALGYIISLIIKGPSKGLEGLTIYTLHKRQYKANQRSVTVGP